MGLHRDITDNEMKAVLTVLKSPDIAYNANSLSKVLKISSMGTLKILKKLEKESILISKNAGRSVIYKINAENIHSKNYVKFLLSSESANSGETVKRWVNEVRKIKNAELIILFGSVLSAKAPNDIDVLLVTDQKRFEKLKREVNELNEISAKKIHPIYQSFEDVVKNIKNKDNVILNAIKGVVAFGEEKFLEIYYESCKE